MKKKKSLSPEHKVFAMQNVFSDHCNLLVKYSALELTEKKSCLCGDFFMKLYENVSVTILLYMSKS